MECKYVIFTVQYRCIALVQSSSKDVRTTLFLRSKKSKNFLKYLVGNICEKGLGVYNMFQVDLIYFFVNFNLRFHKS